MDIVFKGFVACGVLCLIVSIILYRFNRRYKAIDIAINNAIKEIISGEGLKVVYRDNIWLFLSKNKLCLMDNKSRDLSKIRLRLTRKYAIKSLATLSKEDYLKIVKELKKEDFKKFILTINIDKIVGIRVSGDRWTELNIQGGGTYGTNVPQALAGGIFSNNLGNALSQRKIEPITSKTDIKDTRQVSILIEDGRVIKLPYSLYEPLIILLPNKLINV